MQMIKPWPADILLAVTQTFAEHEQRRIQNGWKNYNGGLDVAPYYGNNQNIPILAALPGYVTHASWTSTGYGNHVRINHGNGLETLYGHLEKITIKAGVDVKQGTYLGDMGSTGNATGRHLHFEVRLDGKPVDPEKYLSMQSPAAPIPETPAQESPKIDLPAIPGLPQAQLVAGLDQLNVRTGPMIGAAIVRQLLPGQKVDVIRACKGDDGAIWLQIGFEQFCAMLYKGTQFMEFVM